MPKPNQTLTQSSSRSADNQQTRKPPPKQNDLAGPAAGSGALADIISRPDYLGASDMPILQRSVGNKTAQRMVAQRNARADLHVDSPAAQGGISEDLMTDIEVMIESKLGGGRPLDEQTRTRMESSLMADLTNVRIHTDGDAVWMAQSLSAQAFTVGSDIFFNTGMFNPGNPEGDRLLIHELTHVQQQGGGEAQPAGGTIEIDSISQPGDDDEVVAEQIADQATAGGVGAGSAPEPQADESASVADQAQEDAGEEPTGDSGGAQPAEKKTKAAQQAKQAAGAVNSVGSSPDGAAASAETVAAVVEAIVAPEGGISPEGAAGAVAGAALTKETAGVAKEVTQTDSPGEMAGEVAADISESPAMEQVSSAPMGGGDESSGESNTEGGGSSEEKQEGSDAGGEDTKKDGAGGGAEKKDEAKDKAKDKEEGAEKGGKEGAGEAPAEGAGGGPADMPAPGDFEPDTEAENAADPDSIEIPPILEDGPSAMGDMAGMGAAPGGGGDLDVDADSFATPCMGVEGFGDLLPEMPEELDYAMPPTSADVSEPNAKVEADPTGKGVDKMFKDSALSHSGPSKGLDNLKMTISVLDRILQFMDYVTYAAIGMLVLAAIGIAIASLPFWQLAYKIPLISAFIGHVATFLTWWGVIYFGVRGLSMILRSIMIAVMLTEGVHPDLIRAEADTLTNHAIGTLVDAVMAVGPALYEKKMASRAAAKGASEGAEQAVSSGVAAADDVAGAGAAAADDVAGAGVAAADDVAGAGAAAADDVAGAGVAAADDVAGAGAAAADDVAGAGVAAADDVAGAGAAAADDVAGAGAAAADDAAPGVVAAADDAAGAGAAAADDAAPGAVAAADDAAPGAAAADEAVGPGAAAADEAAVGPDVQTVDDIIDEGVAAADDAAPVVAAADDAAPGVAAADDAAPGVAAADDAAPGAAAADDAAPGVAAADDAAGAGAAAADDALPPNVANAVDDAAREAAETAAANATKEAKEQAYKDVFENTRNFIMGKLMAYTGTAIQNAAKPIGAEGPFSDSTLRGGFGLGMVEDQVSSLENSLINTDDRPVSYKGQTMTYSDAESLYKTETGNAVATLPPGSYTILSPSAPTTGLSGETSALISQEPESEGDPTGDELISGGDQEGAVTPGLLQLAAANYQERLVQNRITVLDDDIKRKQKWDVDMQEMGTSLTKAGGDLTTTNAYLDQQIANANKAIDSYNAVQNNLIATNAMLTAAMIILSVGAYITTDPPIIVMAVMTGIMIAGILASSIASWVKIGERKDEAKAVIANNEKLKTDIKTQTGDVGKSAEELKTTKESNLEEIGEMQERKTELEGMLGTLASLRTDLMESCPSMDGGGTDGEE
jgi:hypothetical protein